MRRGRALTPAGHRPALVAPWLGLLAPRPRSVAGPTSAARWRLPNCPSAVPLGGAIVGPAAGQELAQPAVRASARWRAHAASPQDCRPCPGAAPRHEDPQPHHRARYARPLDPSYSVSGPSFSMRRPRLGGAGAPSGAAGGNPRRRLVLLLAHAATWLAHPVTRSAAHSAAWRIRCGGVPVPQRPRRIASRGLHCRCSRTVF
jgi:hypothetical protein